MARKSFYAESSTASSIALGGSSLSSNATGTSILTSPRSEDVATYAASKIMGGEMYNDIFLASKTSNYTFSRLPNGLIIQSGRPNYISTVPNGIPSNGGPPYYPGQTSNFVFPITFPNAVLAITIASERDKVSNIAEGDECYVSLTGYSTSNFLVFHRRLIGSNGTTNEWGELSFVAIGY